MATMAAAVLLATRGVLVPPLLAELPHALARVASEALGRESAAAKPRLLMTVIQERSCWPYKRKMATG